MATSELARMQKALNRRIALIKALSKFLEDHPELASRSQLKQLGNNVGLNINEKALIRPGGRDRPVLRLERYIEDWQDYDLKERIICADVLPLSPGELDAVLKAAGVDLAKPNGEDDEDEDER
jgi:hypothetical protein